MASLIVIDGHYHYSAEVVILDRSSSTEKESKEYGPSVLS